MWRCAPRREGQTERCPIFARVTRRTGMPTPARIRDSHPRDAPMKELNLPRLHTLGHHSLFAAMMGDELQQAIERERLAKDNLHNRGWRHRVKPDTIQSGPARLLEC